LSQAHRVKEFDPRGQAAVTQLGWRKKVMPQIEELGVHPAQTGEIEDCEQRGCLDQIASSARAQRSDDRETQKNQGTEG
jgi:hypothetical protein